MADVLKLKKKATDLEAKKQVDKALDVYREILEAYEAGEEDVIDIPLYNRVGDMMQKSGNLAEAVSIWEKAVDHYTEGGFYNPAIALCNKILRQSPGRTVIYYKLGKIHAEKGFKGDARQNFLEYAGRQQKAGNLDEAFRALKEFADLVPDQHDVRLMLADQLVKAGRKDEAIAQLQLGYAQATADGEDDAAGQIAAKIKEIDPTVEPKAESSSASPGGGGLVFLDLDGGTSSGGRKSVRGPAPAAVKRATKAVEGLELIEPVRVPEPEPSAAPAAKAPTAQPAQEPELLIEPTDLGANALPPRESLVGLELTNIGEESQPSAAELPLLDIEPTSLESEPDLPLIEQEATLSREFAVVEEGTSFGDPSTIAESESMLGAAADDGFELLEVEASVGSDLPLLGVFEEDVELAGESSLAPALEPSEIEMEPLPVSAPLVADTLRNRVAEAPEDWGLHRQLAEALLEQGERDEAMVEFEAAMGGFELGDDLDTAGSIAEEMVRLVPTSIRYHKKRVEFAFRANDRGRLVEAYTELADALLADGQALQARAVYQRVLDINPDDLRAQAAVESIPEETEPAAPPPRRTTKAAPNRPSVAKPAATKVAQVPADGEDDYVSLGDWLREDDEPKSLRMVVEEQEPTGDEQADFADMLRKFKQGISDNVDDEDHEAHYDLGVAYKEMGLLDEAIAEFQKALRGTKDRVRAFESLGHCFVEKGQLPVAATILQRAVSEPGVRDESLVGVLYLLGAISEELQLFADAKRYYERVFAVDIQFRDIGDRLNTVEHHLS